MFNDIQVLSRTDMIEFSNKIDAPSVIISISDWNQDAPEFADNERIFDVLHLFFDDVEQESSKGMTSDDAEAIIDFIDGWNNENVSLYVHCGAGVSRSAGCAAAIMLVCWGDDKDIFNDGKYAPNMHCYRLVLDAANLEYDDVQLAKKEREQFLLWQEEHADMF